MFEGQFFRQTGSGDSSLFTPTNLRGRRNGVHVGLDGQGIVGVIFIDCGLVPCYIYIIKRGRKAKEKIALGIEHYLTEYHRFRGSRWHAIAAYNAGPRRVIDRRVPETTLRYVEKVLAK